MALVIYGKKYDFSECLLLAWRDFMEVQIFRGPHLESRHQVDWIVMDNDGTVERSGQLDQEKVFPRSAIKMIQRLPLQRLKMQQGVASDPLEIACSCASHAGEACHIHVVENWLRRLQLHEAQLVCGAHAPFDTEASKELIRQGQSPRKVHNNCSGKHTGFLELALLSGASTENYHQISHPIQKLLRQEMETLSECRMQDNDWGVDGCGIPAWRLPLISLSKMFSQFNREAGKASTPEAEIFGACVKNPVLTSGTHEFPALAMQKLAGEVFLKVGAEGLMTALIPAAKKIVVVKVRDGAERATEVAISAILAELFPAKRTALESWLSPAIYNWAGDKVGFAKAAF